MEQAVPPQRGRRGGAASARALQRVSRVRLSCVYFSSLRVLFFIYLRSRRQLHNARSLRASVHSCSLTYRLVRYKRESVACLQTHSPYGNSLTFKFARGCFGGWRTRSLPCIFYLGTFCKIWVYYLPQEPAAHKIMLIFLLGSARITPKPPFVFSLPSYDEDDEDDVV